MTSRDFAYWLQGFFEISGESLETIQAPQLEQIKKHLSMVFVHENDPSHGGPEEQAELNAIHNGPTPTVDFLLQNPHLKPGGQKMPGGAIARC